MKHWILAIACAFGCNQKKDDPVQQADLTEVQQMRDEKVASFQMDQVTPCDRITFVALMDAYGKRLPIGIFEKPAGMWNRNFEVCYPKESKSECSLDGYLSVLHALYARGDLFSIRNMRDYLKARDWHCGLGDEGVTTTVPLMPLIQALANDLKVKVADIGIDLPIPLDIKIDGFQAYLIGNYVWLHTKVFGVSDVSRGIIKKLALDNPEDAFFAALNWRFNGTSQQLAVDLLKQDKPCSDSWGSCDDSVYWTIVVAVLEGR